MHRRDVLRTLAGASLLGLAGCGGPSATGTVVANDTALVVTDHRAGTRATQAGTELYVEAQTRNDGDEPITRSGTVPEFACTFFSESNEQLYHAAQELTRPLNPSDTREFTFELHRRSDEADRYELAITSVEV